MVWQHYAGIYLNRAAKTLRNLELCFPEWSTAEVEAQAKQVFVDMMLGVFETLNAWYCPKWFKGRHSIEGLEHITEAKAQGKGILLLGHTVRCSMQGVIYAHNILTLMWFIVRKIIRRWIC